MATNKIPMTGLQLLAMRLATVPMLSRGYRLVTPKVILKDLQISIKKSLQRLLPGAAMKPSPALRLFPQFMTGFGACALSIKRFHPIVLALCGRA